MGSPSEMRLQTPMRDVELGRGQGSAGARQLAFFSTIGLVWALVRE